MSNNPETKVFIAFDLTESGGSFFTLDDPVRGVLNAPFILGGDLPVDVTDHVASVSISRGKSNELDRYTAGNATITLHNDDRHFDPFYEAGPFFTQILPRKEVTIETNGIRQFSGFIDDWDLQYQLGNKSFATVSAVDGFMQLTATQLNEFTNIEEKSGERVFRILNRAEVAWPIGKRLIDQGRRTLQADTVEENTNVLQYLQLIESTEVGSLFMSRDGAVVFKDRIVGPPIVDTLVFSDGTHTDPSDATYVNYSNIEVVYGSENLYNRITVTREGGLPQTADSVDSQSIYGVQTLSLDGLLLTSDAEAAELANYLLGVYDEPDLRISSVEVNLHDKTPEQQGKLLEIDLQDVYLIAYTPNGIGDPFEQYAFVQGIRETIGIDFHKITYDFGSIRKFPFILDHPVYGVLGGGLPLYDALNAIYDSAIVRYDGQANITADGTPTNKNPGQNVIDGTPIVIQSIP
jgi:hypothetical protein